MWNNKYQDIFLTTAVGGVPLSNMGQKVCFVVCSIFIALYFSGQVYVYLCVETYAGYE